MKNIGIYIFPLFTEPSHSGRLLLVDYLNTLAAGIMQRKLIP